MRELVRRHPWWFTLATLAAIALRLLFIFRFSLITTDSFIYGDIAKNWLLHGIYGISDPSGAIPTYIRLPGYPAFLAAIFAIFGVEHYRAVLAAQMFVDVGTCFVIADMARRTVSARAGKWVFLLAALCPFLANYVDTALTETLEIFFTALTLDLAISGLQDSRWRAWIGCGLATGAAILLRPDGGLLLIAIEVYLFWRLAISLFDRKRVGAPASKISGRQIFLAGVIVSVLALAPLVPWTLRNLHTMLRFQPLAPRYANEENEFVPAGFNRWVKTWIADYASVEEVYWSVPGGEIDPQKLPSRAFDSEEHRAETQQLLADYNDQQHVSPELDARFASLAAQRVRHSPLRYYLWLPLVRIADMWLRPRTELLPSDSRWWEFNDEPKWSALAVGVGVINLLYLGLAVAGVVKGRFVHLGLLLTFVALRSVFLGTLENPEPRYTLECYPVVMVLAAAAFVTSRPPVPLSRDYGNPYLLLRVSVFPVVSAIVNHCTCMRFAVDR